MAVIGGGRFLMSEAPLYLFLHVKDLQFQSTVVGLSAGRLMEGKTPGIRRGLAGCVPNCRLVQGCCVDRASPRKINFRLGALMGLLGGDRLYV